MYELLFNHFASTLGETAAHAHATNVVKFCEGLIGLELTPTEAIEINNVLAAENKNIPFAMAYEASASEADYDEYLATLEAA